MQELEMSVKRRFQLILIKPAHYDEDGYVMDASGRKVTLSRGDRGLVP